MANNNIVKYNTRVQLKYDSLTNWNAVATTFTPLKGEVCVVNPSEDLGPGSTTVLFKVGNGSETFAELPYLSAVAADVYGWAKLPLEQFETLLKDGTVTHKGTTFTCESFATSGRVTDIENKFNGDSAKKAIADGDGNNIKDTYATKSTVEQLQSDIGDLSNVMNFKGVITDDPANITSGYNHGDVVIYGSKEYVYVDQTVDTDATKTGFVEFGDTSTQNQAIENLTAEVANHKSYATIKGTSGTTTAESINDELSIVGDGKITTTVTKDTVTINHAVAGTAAQTIGSATPATPDHGAAFNVIGQVKYDATGHIVGVDEKTVTLPAGYDDSEVRGDIANIKSFSKVQVGNVTLEADAVNDTLNVAAGTAITVTGTANTDTLTIAHSDINPVPGDKGSNKEVAHGGTFDVIESVAVNAQGHVTAYQPRTIQLPEAYDDSALTGRVIDLENTTWKTENVKHVTTDATSTQKGALEASDLTIGSTEINYIIFDCGSSTVNI